jgi:hypothetical protein
MSPQVLSESAQAISDLIDLLEAQGVGPELTQKIVVEATPTIIQAVLYPPVYQSAFGA